MRTLVIISSSTTRSFPRADGEAWVYAALGTHRNSGAGARAGNVADCCAHPCTADLNPCPFAVPRAAWPGILLAALFVPGLAAAAGSSSAWWPPAAPHLWRDPQDPSA